MNEEAVGKAADRPDESTGTCAGSQDKLYLKTLEGGPALMTLESDQPIPDHYSDLLLNVVNEMIRDQRRVLKIRVEVSD